MSARSVPSSPTANSNGQTKSNELADPAAIAKELNWLELLPDASLICQAQAGHNEALDLLLRRHRQALLDHARYHCGNCFLVEDLCQETCLSLLAHLPDLREPKAFAGWMHTSLTNASRNCRRRNCKKVGTTDPEADPYKMEDLSVEAGNHSTLGLMELWSVLCQQASQIGGKSGRVAAFMLEFYDRHEEFPTVRDLAEATHSSLGTAERCRAAVLRAWQRALTALNLYP